MEIDSHSLDSPAAVNVDYPINGSFEDLEKFKSLQNELKKELLLSLDKYPSFCGTVLRLIMMMVPVVQLILRQ